MLNDIPIRPYHVVQAIYFEPCRELPASDFLSLWSGTRVLGNLRIEGNFWSSGGPGGQRRLDLGSTSGIEAFAADNSAIVYGGGTSTELRSGSESTLGRKFYYAYAPQSRCFGYDTLPHILYAVSGDAFEQAGSLDVLRHMREHFTVADKQRPRYGLIDIADSADNYAGMVYSSHFLGTPACTAGLSKNIGFGLRAVLMTESEGCIGETISACLFSKNSGGVIGLLQNSNSKRGWWTVHSVPSFGSTNTVSSWAFAGTHSTSAQVRLWTSARYETHDG